MNSPINISIVKIVLFDLGGVLVDLNGPPVNPTWIGTVKPGKDPAKDWASCSAIYAFETGRMSAHTFAEAAIAEFSLNAGVDAFLEHFARWPKLSSEAPGLIKRLRPGIQKAVLSNTNALHWQQEMLDTGFADLFDHCFASFQTGFFKPEKQAYLDVCEHMQTRAERVLFLDDKIENVETARSVGMMSERVNGIGNVAEVLDGFGLLV